MVYLTFNDLPSGIFSGQVIDVCSFLNNRLNAKIRLVSLISLRGFFRNRKKIKAEMPDAVVLPMFPGVQNWPVNMAWLVLIFIFWGRLHIIARGPFAASLALKMKKLKLASKVCFDARGAYTAEFNEYNVAGNKKMNQAIFSVEKNALLNADIRIAVSCKLVTYWADTFGYKANEHVVIPCTLSSRISGYGMEDGSMRSQRAALGFSDNDVLLVYAGSSAGWQSAGLLDDFLCVQMKEDPCIKVLFLTDDLPAAMKVTKQFPGRVVLQWLGIDQVAGVLRCCDYGLLIREGSVTNSVSAPVKFAEYLAAGLQVIISEGIGDYPDLVRKHGCGIVIGSLLEVQTLQKVPVSVKNKNASLASTCFSKESHLDAYAKVLSVIQ